MKTLKISHHSLQKSLSEGWFSLFSTRHLAVSILGNNRWISNTPEQQPQCRNLPAAVMLCHKSRQGKTEQWILKRKY
ncbi:MAG: hypothetical protein M0Q95_07150 [Porticoccaceae bacterium]|nr:hypothetical protein [Porticoccaceae bacterium]